MALFNQLIKTFKDKAPGQRPIGKANGGNVPSTTGQEQNIVDSIEQFSLGSQRPGDNSEAEEVRTNRRANRGVTNGILEQRRAGRFNRGAF